MSRVDLHQAAREHLVAHGIDPDAPAERVAFSLAEHMVANAMYLLDAHVPTVFQAVEPDHPDVSAWVDAYIADPQKARGLFMMGPTGSGKSHQAYGALRQIVLTNARNRHRFLWRATNFADFNAAMRPNAEDTHITELESFQKTDVLLLDDLGAGLTSAWTDDNLYRLIDYRWSHMLPTIVTTNLSGKRVLEVFDERVVSRLRASVQVILNGRDRRAPAGGAA